MFAHEERPTELLNVLFRMRHANLFALILTIVLTLTALAASAQTTVQCKITDLQNNPVEFANVLIETSESSFSTMTGADGRVRFPVHLPSDVHIRCTQANYVSIDTVVKYSATTLTVCLPMRPKSQLLEELTVGAGGNAHIAHTKLQAENLQRLSTPIVGVESLIKMLPDVASNNELSSQYSVRGGSFDENLVYINNIEVLRPTLVHAAQQEGLSIVNPDLVSNIYFSPGGFAVSYGEKLSSVLDITYSTLAKEQTKLSLSPLGATLSSIGKLGKGLTYAVGGRLNSNNYLLSSLKTKGDYRSTAADEQALVSYRPSETWTFNLLAMGSQSKFGFVPRSSTIGFGGISNPMELNIYFDGQENDLTSTALAATSITFQPSNLLTIDWSLALQNLNEQERFDIQSQYWLNEVSLSSSNHDTTLRGVGTYLEHARNNVQTTVITSTLHISQYARLGSWSYGAILKREWLADNLREWKWVDSAGYPLPYSQHLPDSAPTLAPTLQNFTRAHNSIAHNRASIYALRTINLLLPSSSQVSINLGARLSLYSLYIDTLATLAHHKDELFFNPRLNIDYTPAKIHHLVLKASAGIYSQPPFFREYRTREGLINPDLEPQHSYQAVGTADYSFSFRDKPFHLTADIYYKYITNFIPYHIENLRLYYDAHNRGTATTSGISLRLNAQLLPEAESWASLSLMKASYTSDTLIDMPLPSDQRIAFKLFFQDNLPHLPYWRMSLSLFVASGLPVSTPLRNDITTRLPLYFRADWGNTIMLSQLWMKRHPDIHKMLRNVSLSVDIFNLFDYDNVASFIWVADFDGLYYHVPNFLTARQLSITLSAIF